MKYYNLDSRSPYYPYMQDTSIESSLTEREKKELYNNQLSGILFGMYEGFEYNEDEKNYLCYSAVNKVESEIAFNIMQKADDLPTYDFDEIAEKRTHYEQNIVSQDDYLSFKDIDNNAERFEQYFFKSTNVLKNYFKIKDNNELQKLEKRLVTNNTKKLKDISQPYDFNYIIYIHKTLFDNIYPFAGQLRQANMGKGNQDTTMSRFFDYQEIPFHIQHFNHYIKSKNYLSGINDKEQFAYELCELYLFINDIHAFREGNGRTQNMFINQLAKKNGYELTIQNALQNYSKEGIDYNQWFKEYAKTNSSEKILTNFFIKNLRHAKQ